MIEVHPNLWIGNEQDYSRQVRAESGWSVVHACKEPFHRQTLGYTGRAAPKNHPEYLIARRDNRLILNLVDAPDPAYIPKEIIDAALEFIDHGLRDLKKTLVHCNLGESRAPTIGLLYLAAFTKRLLSATFEEAEVEFRALCAAYNPNPGMRGFAKIHYSEYRARAATP